MKKKLKVLGLLAVAVVAAYNVYASHVESEYSDVILTNVEALAEGEILQDVQALFMFVSLNWLPL